MCAAALFYTTIFSCAPALCTPFQSVWIITECPIFGDSSDECSHRVLHTGENFPSLFLAHIVYLVVHLAKTILLEHPTHMINVL